jgi:glycerol-3-phosphate dehydrogenase (NAD(P)+)
LIRAAVIGAGSWGTALALHLARSGAEVALWARSPATAAALERARENTGYLPGHRLPPNVRVSSDLAGTVRGTSMVLFVAPAQASRAIYAAAAPHLPEGADLVIASKGIEEGSLLRLSQVLARVLGTGDESPRVMALSGPSFALEVARGDPTGLVVAGPDPAATRRVQEALSTGNVRAYRNGDRTGVETCAALKNVMAIATGIAEGIGFGFNTRAALITRGLSEMSRLGAALGGRPETFAGLAGAGDLILTCTGALSRNRAVGIEAGRGRRLEEILGEMRMVAEGVATTRAAVVLAERQGVDMPIARQVHRVLFEGRPPREAVAELLARPLKEEA